MPHKTFEELPVWRAGRELVWRIYALTRCPEVAGDRGFRDQIQRVAVSITNAGIYSGRRERRGAEDSGGGGG